MDSGKSAHIDSVKLPIASKEGRILPTILSRRGSPSSSSTSRPVTGSSSSTSSVVPATTSRGFSSSSPIASRSAGRKGAGEFRFESATLTRVTQTMTQDSVVRPKFSKDFQGLFNGCCL